MAEQRSSSIDLIFFFFGSPRQVLHLLPGGWDILWGYGFLLHGLQYLVGSLEILGNIFLAIQASTTGNY